MRDPLTTIKIALATIILICILLFITIYEPPIQRKEKPQEVISQLPQEYDFGEAMRRLNNLDRYVDTMNMQLEFFLEWYSTMHGWEYKKEGGS